MTPNTCQRLADSRGAASYPCGLPPRNPHIFSPRIARHACQLRLSLDTAPQPTTVACSQDTSYGVAMLQQHHVHLHHHGALGPWLQDVRA